MTYPITEAAALVDGAAVRFFLETLFGDVDFEPGQTIVARGLGEKGTPREGDFRENIWLQPGSLGAELEAHARRWAQYHVGTFLVPAVMHASSYTDQEATEAHVAAFTSVLVDLDDVPTAQAGLAWLVGVIGPASMVVESSPGKIHAYWIFNEPETRIADVANVRLAMANLVGGDPSFVRLPQVVRVPGTVHAKHGGQFVTKVIGYTQSRYELDDIRDKVQSAQPMPGAPERKAPARSAGGQGFIDFTPDSAALANDTLAATMTTDIDQGGTGDQTRWSAFSRVAGHYIAQVRSGAVADLDEAKNLTAGWVEAHMVTKWPPARFEAEWQGLVNKDTKDKGPITARRRGVNEVDTLQPPASAPAIPEGMTALATWAAHRWAVGTPPARNWLAHGLVLAGQPHMLAAEGGSGKSFLLAELGLMLTAPREGDHWIGAKINHAACADGTVVIFMAEDDQHEVHRRLEAIDPGGVRRREAGDRLIMVPLPSAGGVFPLVERGANGNAVWHPGWSAAVEQLYKVPKLMFLGIDTMPATLHGDENSSVVANEWLRAVTPVCAKLGSAFMFTHHPKKADRRNRPVNSIEDFAEEVRGSSAFQANIRMAIGIYRPANWQKRLEGMGMATTDKRALWRAGVMKANNSEAMRGERTLVRDYRTGSLVDATDKDTVQEATSAAASVTPEQRAWMLEAIRHAEAADMPLTPSSLGKPASHGSRVAELPPALICDPSNPQELVPPAVRAAIINDLCQPPHGPCVLRSYKGKGGGQIIVMRGGPWHLPEVEKTKASGTDMRHIVDWSTKEYCATSMGVLAKVRRT
jgi:hypothetical protein